MVLAVEHGELDSKLSITTVGRLEILESQHPVYFFHEGGTRKGCHDGLRLTLFLKEQIKDVIINTP